MTWCFSLTKIFLLQIFFVNLAIFFFALFSTENLQHYITFLLTFQYTSMIFSINSRKIFVRYEKSSLVFFTSSVKNYRTTFLSQKQRPKSQQSNPAITAILQDLASSNPSSNEDTVETAKIREKASNCSRFGSKRNSLDKQSVQTLAQDLAAECAKAYALMESSLSKLSSDLGVTPFGLAPKSKVSPCTLKAYTIYLCNNVHHVTN